MRKPRRLLFHANIGTVDCKIHTDSFDKKDISSSIEWVVHENETMKAPYNYCELNLKQAKKLHDWLGRYIKWSDSK